jgi:hypothetical protein
MNSNLVLIGFLIILICQDIVAVRAFRRSAREGLFCVLIPGYAVYYGSRDETRQMNPVIGWLAGFGILLLGFFG